MMRFRTLQFQLSSLVLAFGLLAIGLGAVRQYRHDLRERLDQVRRNAYQEGTRLASLTQHFFRRRLPNSTDLALSYASVDADLHLAVICDGKDQVLYATQKQWRGLPLWSCPLSVTPHLVAATRKSFEGVLSEDAERGRLTAVFPFRDAGNSTGQSLVVLEYDLHGVTSAATRQMLNELAAQSCLLLGGCVLLWGLLQVVVTERVSKIVEQTRHIDTEGGGQEPIPGSDELAGISTSIALATRRLQASEWRFKQIATNMRDIFWVAPPKGGGPVYVNEAYEKLFGRPAGILAAKPWDWLRAMPREDGRAALKMLRDLRHRPGEVEIEVRVVSKERIEWVRCRGFSTPWPGGGLPQLQVAGVAAIITEEKEMEKRLLDAAENERRRIGQDLHDNVCQRVTAAQLKSGVLGSSLKREKHAQAALAADVAQELAEAADVARGYARGLAPVAVRAEELPDALDDLRQFLERAFGISCRIACEDVSEVLRTADAAQVFRIAQELAINAAKHGRASWISISIAHDQKVLRLEVANDGVVFDPAVSGRKKGMGLHMLRQRSDALGAALTFEPFDVAQGGTLAICEVPLARS